MTSWLDGPRTILYALLALLTAAALAPAAGAAPPTHQPALRGPGTDLSAPMAPLPALPAVAQEDEDEEDEAEERKLERGEDPPPVDPDREVMLILADGEVNLSLNIEGVIFHTIEIEGEICDKDEKECDIRFKIGALNKSSSDWKIHATVMLLGGGGKLLEIQTGDEKIDEDDEETLTIKFELPPKRHRRVKKCRIKFELEED